VNLYDIRLKLPTGPEKRMNHHQRKKDLWAFCTVLTTTQYLNLMSLRSKTVGKLKNLLANAGNIDRWQSVHYK